MKRTNLFRRHCCLMMALQAHQETDKGPPATTESPATKPRTVVLDSDSFEIGVDNRASRCMSHCSEDFEGPLRRSHKRVRGWMNALSDEVRIGTITMGRGG